MYLIFVSENKLNEKPYPSLTRVARLRIDCLPIDNMFCYTENFLNSIRVFECDESKATTFSRVRIPYDVYVGYGAILNNKLGNFRALKYTRSTHFKEGCIGSLVGQLGVINDMNEKS